MRRYILSFICFFCLLHGVSAGNYYRVTAQTVNARENPRTSAKVLFQYREGEVLVIDECRKVGKYTWGRVENSNPSEWVAINNLREMTPQEVEQFTKKFPKNKLAAPTSETSEGGGYSWAHFNPELADLPAYELLYWITVILAIYSLVFFIILYDEAKRRKVFTAHIVYGICSLGLWFWVFFFGTWQWLLMGFLWAVPFYPLAFTDVTKKEGLVSFIEVASFIGCLIASWYLLRAWEKTALTVGFFSWLLCIILAFVNASLQLVLGTGRISDTCPSCHYYCEQKMVDSEYKGSTNTSSSYTEVNDYWDHRKQDYDETSNVLTTTDYYRRERTRTTTLYRIDHYTNTYYCPHCHYTYKSDSSIKHRTGRYTERI